MLCLSGKELRGAAGGIQVTATVHHHRMSLRRLDLSNNALGADGVSALAVQLPALSMLEELDLSTTGASDRGAIALGSATIRCDRLRELKMVGCFIKSKGGSALAAALREMPALESLGLGWNSISGVAARDLADAVLASPRLSRFCGLPLDLMRAGTLPPVPPLTERDLMRRPMIPPTEELHLQGHGCGAPGALVIAALLPRLPKHLSAVCMPFQGAPSLLPALVPTLMVGCPRLVLTRVLPASALDDSGAAALVEACVAAKLPLRFLMLSRNDISDEAHEQFRAQLPHLDSFHLRVNARGG